MSHLNFTQKWPKFVIVGYYYMGEIFCHHLFNIDELKDVCNAVNSVVPSFTKKTVSVF